MTKALVVTIVTIVILGFAVFSADAQFVPVEPEPTPVEPDPAEETISEIEPTAPAEGGSETTSPEYNAPVFEGPQTSEDILEQFE